MTRFLVSKLALKGDPTFRLRGESGFYDGAYFYAIARDPLATGEAHHLLTRRRTTGATRRLGGSPRLAS